MLLTLGSRAVLRNTFSSRSLVTGACGLNSASSRWTNPHPKRNLSTAALWRLRPYAQSSMSSAVLNPLAPGVALTGLTLFVAPPMQIAQFALTVPTVVGASYLTVLLGQRMASGGAFQHNYFALFLQLALSFLPMPSSQNMIADLMFTAMWLTGSFFAYNMLPELLLKDHVFTLFLVSFMIPLFPLAFTFMPLFNTRAYLTL